MAFIPGIQAPTGNLAMGFTSPTVAGTNVSLSPYTSDVVARYAHYKMMILTANNEATAAAFATLPTLDRMPQYILGFEVDLSSGLTPLLHNGWHFGIKRCLQNIAFKPDAWWHQGMTTVISGAAVNGTSITVNDITQVATLSAPRVDTVTYSSASNTITDTSVKSSDFGCPVSGTNIPPNSYVGTVNTTNNTFLLSSTSGYQTNVSPTGSGTSVTIVPALGILDIFSSTGVYKGMIQYGTITGSVVGSIPKIDSISGATSDFSFGAIGYNPGTISTLTTGTYTPGIQCSAGIVAGDIVWSRVSSNQSSTSGGGGFWPEPRSASYNTWLTQSYAYYLNTVTDSNHFTELLLDNMDTGTSRWLSHAPANPVRPAGTFSNGVFIVTNWTTTLDAINGSTMTDLEYTNSYVQNLKTIASIAPGHKLWGNATSGSAPWSQTVHDAFVLVLNSYAAAGVTGVILEPGGGMAGQYSSPGWFNVTQLDLCLDIYRQMNALGVGVCGITQTQSSTYATALAEGRDNAAYAFHLLAWNENNYYFAPTSSNISGAYHQDWPRTAPFQQFIGRPTAAYTKSVGASFTTYFRQFEYGTVTVVLSNSTTGSAPTVTFTRTLP